MRLRRLELIIIGVTLAFLVFLGGYFTGLKNPVNVIPASAVSKDPLPQSPDGSDKTGAASGAPSATHATPPVVAPSVVNPESPDATAPEATTPGATEPPATPAVNDGRININTASKSELMDLPGIGSVLAERIVEYRNKNGYFAKTEDLRKVSGIGSKRFEAIQDKIKTG